MKLASAARAAYPPLLVFLGFLGLWQLACAALALPTYLVPTPAEVARQAVEHAGELAQAALLTAIGALGGLGASLLVGGLVAVLFSQSRTAARSLYPYAIFLQTVPIVAVAPLIVVWFGTGLQSVILTAAILSVFPIITNGTTGLVRVDPQLLELFAMSDASRLQLLLKLRLPGSLPYFVAGAKISGGLAVIGAIVGEFFAGFGADDLGLGALILQTSGRLQTAYLFAAIFAATLLGLVLFGAVALLGELALRRWRGRELSVH
ncbi:ABC transporter permease [Nannocystis bainbridge]|uniref:ABC transporter permease n=1 Tax=Nannocystis bainbridge TaxID=2995303 RepID=A0ABT5E271_9BACT|nr:ABC transporter permease [Nannocystis bainbridge]MDC0718847.1 ABC transporter permease [Nannocystis bainbridge]